MAVSSPMVCGCVKLMFQVPPSTPPRGLTLISIRNSNFPSCIIFTLLLPHQFPTSFLLCMYCVCNVYTCTEPCSYMTSCDRKLFHCDPQIINTRLSLLPCNIPRIYDLRPMEVWHSAQEGEPGSSWG